MNPSHPVQPTRTRKGSFILAFLLLLGLFVFITLQLSDESPSEEIAVIALEEEQEEEQDEDATEAEDIAPVTLRFDGEPSQSALEELETGRFLVETRIPSDANRGEIFRQLLLRGGIVVARDADLKHSLLSSDTQRQPLESANLVFEEFDFERPRQLEGRDARFLPGRRISAGDTLFLVMPRVFEARLLTEIESMLDQPLTEYAYALLLLETSRGGHLIFRIDEVRTNNGDRHSIGATIRGL